MLQFLLISVGVLLLAAPPQALSADAYADAVARGDTSWERRAVGELGGRPLKGPVLDAIQFYEQAVLGDPSSLEARWKLLRALHFVGEFAVADDQGRRAFFERAIDVSEQGRKLLAQRFDDQTALDDMEAEDLPFGLDATNSSGSDIARFYFWSAINWGGWSREAGLLGAVRQGVANRLYRYTRVTIALEPDYDEGGAFRLLGRLHAELPRVPFVSGWVDRKKAIGLIEQAYDTAPTNPGNRLLLGLTLLELAPDREDEARALLQQVATLTPRPSMRIEDIQMRGAAASRLATLGKAKTESGSDRRSGEWEEVGRARIPCTTS